MTTNAHSHLLAVIKAGGSLQQFHIDGVWVGVDPHMFLQDYTQGTLAPVESYREAPATPPEAPKPTKATRK